MRSPRTIRARLQYDLPPPQSVPAQAQVKASNDTTIIRSTHQFITDRYNPVSILLDTPSPALSRPATSTATNETNTKRKQLHEPPSATPIRTKLATHIARNDDRVEQLKSKFEQNKTERDQSANEFAEYLKIAMKREPSSVHTLIDKTQDESTNAHESQACVLVQPTVTVPDKEPIAVELIIKPSPEIPHPQRAKPPPTFDIPMLNIVSPSRAHQSKAIASATQHPTTNNRRMQPPPSLAAAGECSSVGPGTGRTVFDSARARRYMAEQQRKRRAAKTASATAKQSLVERKRRLDELQLQTRQIVQRNVCKNAVRQAGRARNVRTEMRMLTARDQIGKQ